MEPKIRFKGFEGEWKASTIGDFTTSFSGGTPTAGASEFYGGNIPFIRSGEIHESKTELFLTEAGLNNSSAKVVEKGTLLYALYGATSGEVGISKIKGAINQAILAIYPNKTVDKRFLANYLQSHKQKIVGELLQGGQGNLSGALVKSISVTYPNNREQQTISDYVDSLDSQISASTSRLASLKQMKAASLQAMFPQEGETVPKIRFKGFEGEWTWLKLGDISEQVKRKAPINSTAPVMMISALNGFINQSEKYSDNNAGSSLANYTLLKKGELSYNHGYSKTRNFGSCFNLLVEEARIPFVYHSFRLTNDNDSFYAYYLNSGTKDKDLKRLVSSTARMDGLLNISFKNYMELSVPHPSLAEQQAIANYFTSLDRQISLQSQRLEKLKQIKSACLDKMFV